MKLDGTHQTTCVRTRSGLLFDLAAPDPADVRLHDIAEQTAKVNRFVGAPIMPLSVAQHCVFVSRLCEAEDPLAAPYGLLHDAEEAYTGDWSSPLKRLFAMRGAGEITERISHEIRAAIFAHFGLTWPAPPHLWAIVKHCDNISYVTERRDYMGGDLRPLPPPYPEPRKFPYRAWAWAKAADEFIQRARELGLRED